MPYALTVISLLVQGFFYWHAYKNMTCCADRWMLTVLAIPVLGPALYFFLVYAPMEMSAKQKRGLQNIATNIIDPKRALREARLAYERTTTPANAQRLAEVLLAKGDLAEAESLLLLVAAQTGDRDVRLLTSLAEVAFKQQKFSAALAYLDEALGQMGNNSRSAALTLQRGRVLEQMGNMDAAITAYRDAAHGMGGEEARCRLAGALLRQGQNGEAKQILAEVNKRLSVAPIHYRSEQAEWVKAAKQLDRACKAA